MRTKAEIGGPNRAKSGPIDTGVTHRAVRYTPAVHVPIIGISRGPRKTTMGAGTDRRRPSCGPQPLLGGDGGGAECRRPCEDASVGSAIAFPHISRMDAIASGASSNRGLALAETDICSGYRFDAGGAATGNQPGAETVQLGRHGAPWRRSCATPNAAHLAKYSEYFRLTSSIACSSRRGPR